MFFLLLGIKTDLTQRLRDRWQLAIWIGVPLLLGVMITLVMGGSDGPKPVAKLIIADEDQTTLSKFFAGAWSQGAFADLVDVETASRTEGEQRIADGDGSGLLIIPKGFAEAALKDEPVELTLVTNPSQNILPKILSEGTSILIDAAYYAQRLFGTEIKSIMDSTVDDTDGPSDVTVASISVSINQRIQAIEQFVFPPVIGVESGIDEKPKSNQVSFSLLFFPGILIMSLLFMGQGISSDFWKAREQGTLRRLATTPRSTIEYLAAKTLSVFLLIMLVSTVLVILGFAYHAVDFSKLPLAVLWLTVSGIVLFAMMSIIQLLSPSQKAASLMTSILIFPLMMAGGSFFPFEAMPGWLANIGRLSPNGHMNRVFKEFMLDRINASELGVELFVLTLAALVLLLLIALRLRSFTRAPA
jgi:ABC-type multidrug transport system permease subunit